MRTVEQLTQAVQQLSRAELMAFRAWFHTYEAEVWDQQIEADMHAGTLDTLADAAIADHRAGRSQEL